MLNYWHGWSCLANQWEASIWSRDHQSTNQSPPTKNLQVPKLQVLLNNVLKSIELKNPPLFKVILIQYYPSNILFHPLFLPLHISTVIAILPQLDDRPKYYYLAILSQSDDRPVFLSAASV